MYTLHFRLNIHVIRKQTEKKESIISMETQINMVDKIFW